MIDSTPAGLAKARERVCGRCGSTFVCKPKGRPPTYCETCKSGPPRVCPCGEPAAHRHGPPRCSTCSQLSKLRVQADSRRRRGIGQKGPDLPACKWCGSPIPERPPGHAGRGRLYCGDDCRSASNNAIKSAKVQNQRRCSCGALPKNRRGPPVCLECFERRAAYLSRRRTLAPYGLTPEGYDDLLDRQGLRCAICASSDPGGAYFVVDHDHATGAVRGLLCVKCNTGLGMFSDDIASLLNAAMYLQRPRGTPP